MSFVRFTQNSSRQADDSDLSFSVTSVGGTENIQPEVAVSRFYSGGGFSNYVRDDKLGNYLLQ